MDDDQPTSETPQPAGGLGGSIRTGRGSRDTRLIERALREQWAIPDQYRDPIVNRQIRIAIDPSASNREATSAARCLVSMQQQNQDAALKLLDKYAPDLLEATGSVEHRHTITELLQDPEYVEWRRGRERHSLPSPVCTNGHAPNGKPLANGESCNGH